MPIGIDLCQQCCYPVQRSTAVTWPPPAATLALPPVVLPPAPLAPPPLLAPQLLPAQLLPALATAGGAGNHTAGSATSHTSAPFSQLLDTLSWEELEWLLL